MASTSVATVRILVEGNLIGTDGTGTIAIANGQAGILIGSGSTQNTIGGTASGAGNLISGNAAYGVVLSGGGNLLAGNLIGTDITGTVVLPNAIGVAVSGASNTIGGTVATAQNLISGNMNAGIQISSSTATDNVVEGNRIGTALDGAQALANGAGPGVAIEYFATGNTIGGTTPGAANLISGNAGGGVVIYGHGTIDNVVAGNIIGTNDDGTLTLASENGAGVKIYGGAAQNTIGGTVSGAGNLISGNKGDGVQIIDGYQDYVQGNRIGLDRSGTGALANSAYGISLSQHFPAQTTSGYTTSGPGSHTGSNVIGGTGSAARNVVSGNGAGGIFITSGIMDLVAGNYVGVDSTGGGAIANGGDGIQSVDSSGNTIGGSVPGAGNLISGNTGFGIALSNDSAFVVQGNLVGTDFNGSSPIPNTAGGLDVFASASNTIGGTTPGATNLFSGNNGPGVIVEGSGSTGNLISGNQMVHDVTGVVIESSASQNTIGGTAAGAGNTIVLNAGAGIDVGSSATDTSTENALLGNAIYANGGLGIDLGNDGVTPNDSSGHTGPNLFQNFPVVSSAVTAGATTTIAGTITAAANTTYRVEFFSDPTLVGLGFGQGQNYLTFADVTTGPGGTGTFSTPTPSAVSPGSYVSATATDPAGNTSEFSADSIVTMSSIYVVTNTADSGAGSLRQAILDSNATPGPNTIDFDISTSDSNYDSGNNSWTITPLSPLPAVSVPTTIDGDSQPGTLAPWYFPVIVLNGSSAGTGADGLDLTAGNSSIIALTINGFNGNGVSITSDHNTVLDSIIGSDVTETVAVPNAVGIFVIGRLERDRDHRAGIAVYKRRQWRCDLGQ